MMKIDNKLILVYSRNLNILYVEDDEQLRDATASIFKNYFANVDIAIDGKNALAKYEQYYKENNKYYDLIISDINMPIMNGVEFASIVLEENYEQAIIFITAHNEVEYLQKSIDLGINGFITKPIKMEQLKKILFKVVQAVYDRKTSALHYEVIEKFNIELESKNKVLEKSLRVLNTIIEKSILCVDTQDLKVSMSNQMSSFLNDHLVEIKDIHKEIDSNVITVISSNCINIQSNIDIIGIGFDKYASILSSYTCFHDLSTTMRNFSVTIRDNKPPKDEMDIRKIFVFLESFMFVLEKWSEALTSNSNDNLNYLDASLISDMQTIISMWTK